MDIGAYPCIKGRIVDFGFWMCLFRCEYQRCDCIFESSTTSQVFWESVLCAWGFDMSTAVELGLHVPTINPLKQDLWELWF